MEKNDDYLLVCSRCGKSDNVQVKAWVNANTNEYEDDSTLDSSDTWCGDCEDHTGLILKQDFDYS